MSFLAARQVYIAFSRVVSFEIRCWLECSAGWLVYLWFELKVMNDDRFVDWIILCNTTGHELTDMICYGYCIAWYRIALYNVVFLE